MLVYNNPGFDGTNVVKAKDIISISGNSGQISNVAYPTPACPAGGNCLTGANGGILTTALCASTAAAAASYYGVLFFQSHDTHGVNLTHTLDGSGGLTIVGTTYMTSLSSTIETLNLQGNSGSTTNVQGEIIVDDLGMGGGPTINMNLSTISCFQVRQVALIQ